MGWLELLRPAWTIPGSVLAVIGYVLTLLDLGVPGWVLAALGTALVVVGLLKSIATLKGRVGAVTAMPSSGPAWLPSCEKWTDSELHFELRALVAAQFSNLTCVVEDPAGVCAIGNQPQLMTFDDRGGAVMLSYPSEFGLGKAPRQGTYKVQWMLRRPGEQISAVVARGTWDIRISPEAPPAE